MELGLTSGEVREATGANGETIRVYAVAGGSFTHVQVRGADGHLIFSRNERIEDTALRAFAEQKAQHGAVEYTEDGYGVAETAEGVRCGAHRPEARVYHANAASVGACYELMRHYQAEQAAELAAERAIERHFEDRGYEAHRAQEDWEARNGVVPFDEAYRQALEDEA